MRTVYLIILVIISYNLAAQKAPKCNISINAGINYPLGKFSKNIVHKGSGYALSGFNYNFDGNYLITKHFGVSGVFIIANNDFDITAFKRYMEINLGYTNSEYTLNIDNWKMWGIMFGPYYTYTVSEKMRFDLCLVIGSLTTTLPGMNINAIDYATGDYIKFEQIAVTGTGPGSNLSIVYLLNFHKIFVKLTSNLMVAHCEFRNVSGKTYVNNILNSEKGGNESANIINLGVTAGIGWRVF